jgi:hypothetical protein
MGMGLPICRSIIDAHGGGCWQPDASRGVLSFSLRSPLTEPPDVAYWPILLQKLNIQERQPGTARFLKGVEPGCRLLR